MLSIYYCCIIYNINWFIFNLLLKFFKLEIWKKKSSLKISKKWISKNNSIGIRIPDHNVPKKIINKCNFPIFCTSANISSKKSCRNIKDIVKNFKNKKITVINDGKTKFGLDSTIIDVTKNKINILRNGYINKKKLKNLIN